MPMAHHPTPCCSGSLSVESTSFIPLSPSKTGANIITLLDPGMYFNTCARDLLYLAEFFPFYYVSFSHSPY